MSSNSGANSPIILIRPEQPTFYERISEIHRIAFGGEVEPGIVEKLRAASDFDPKLSLMALYDGQVVGHAVFSPATIVGHENLKGMGLGPVGVLPEYQNQGIGSALCYEGLEVCRKSGIDYVVVLGHPTYYPRFGFVIASTKGLNNPFKAPDEAFMVIELKPGALDSVSGDVRFHPAFDGIE
ncbi:MAG TPA: N-acetyltransferase [Aggregatilineales bacterium]|nr:N-acetyltransferase [Aggregatilineales bacterium]